MMKQTGMKYTECKSKVDSDYIYFELFLTIKYGIKCIGTLIVFNSPFVFLCTFSSFLLVLCQLQSKLFPLVQNNIYLFITFQQSCLKHRCSPLIFDCVINFPLFHLIVPSAYLQKTILTMLLSPPDTCTSIHILYRIMRMNYNGTIVNIYQTMNCIWKYM